MNRPALVKARSDRLEALVQEWEAVRRLRVGAVDDRRRHGRPRREQLIYEAVDQYLAKALAHKSAGEAAALQRDLSAAREDVKRRIADIWNAPAVTE